MRDSLPPHRIANGHFDGPPPRNGNGHAGHLPARGRYSFPEGQPRVLILSAAVGSGHQRAAEAVDLAFRRLYPRAEVHRADVLDLSLPIFRFCYGGLYLTFIDKAPFILRFFYNLMDRPRDCSAPSRGDKLRVFLEKIGLRRFLNLLHSRPWDLIISTHFLAGEIIADQKRKGLLSTPQVMVTTDFETTHSWITQPCELYTTATEESALFLEKQGVPAGHTRILGIPIHPVFCEDKDRAACLRRHQLAGDRPVLLQLNGGHGVGHIEELFRALLDVEEPCEVVAVTGHNEEAKRRLEQIAPPPRHRVKVFGYTTAIDELMRAADLIVSKPGGLTTSESLACGTPLVIVDPVPGQEERNSDLLLENGASIKVNHPLTLGYKVTELLRDPDRLAELRANARRLARPRAAFDVVEETLALLQPKPLEARSVSEGNPSLTLRASIETRSASEGTPADGASDANGHRQVANLPPRVERKRPSARGWFEVLEVEGLSAFAHLWHRCSSSGPDGLPECGPAIVVANHPNYSDPAFLVHAWMRPLKFLQARESFDTPLLCRLFARVGSLPVARNGHDVTGVRAALKRLEKGEIVCVFPEGEVHGNGGRPETYRGGAAFLALKSGAPVYPAHIIGGPRSGSILRDWLWPSAGVRVHVGPPVDLSAYRGLPLNRAIIKEVTRLIMSCVEELKLSPETTLGNGVRTPLRSPSSDRVSGL